MAVVRFNVKREYGSSFFFYSDKGNPAIMQHDSFSLCLSLFLPLGFLVCIEGERIHWKHTYFFYPQLAQQESHLESCAFSNRAFSMLGYVYTGHGYAFEYRKIISIISNNSLEYLSDNLEAFCWRYFLSFFLSFFASSNFMISMFYADSPQTSNSFGLTRQKSDTFGSWFYY